MRRRLACLVRGHDPVTVIDEFDEVVPEAFSLGIRARVSCSHRECARCGRLIDGRGYRRSPGNPEPNGRAALLAFCVGAACVIAGTLLGRYGIPWLLS